jgi:hypothetical protein
MREKTECAQGKTAIEAADAAKVSDAIDERAPASPKLLKPSKRSTRGRNDRRSDRSRRSDEMPTRAGFDALDDVRRVRSVNAVLLMQASGIKRRNFFTLPCKSGAVGVIS